MPREAICRRCAKPIRWYRTANGKWQPVNLDGKAHRSTCDRGRKLAALLFAPIVPAPGGEGGAA